MKPALLNCERESIINMHVTCLSMANMLPNMSNKTYCFVCFISLLEYNCFTTLYQFLLYNKVNQLYVYVYPHIPSLLSLLPTLPIPPLNHRADLPVLCSSSPLAICFTFGSAYMSMLPSHFVPAYPPNSPCPQVHSLHVSLFLSCPQVHWYRFFRFHICALAYGTCFSLSDLLHSV